MAAQKSRWYTVIVIGLFAVLSVAVVLTALTVSRNSTLSRSTYSDDKRDGTKSCKLTANKLREVLENICESRADLLLNVNYGGDQLVCGSLTTKEQTSDKPSVKLRHADKVHLETEQEETREKEREKTRQRMIERQKQERKKEENMLFGSQKEPVPGDPIYPFRHYYDAAKHSLDSLVAIRREWDSYLTTAGVGSCIPDTWVIPVEPSSESWGSALKHDQMT